MTATVHPLPVRPAPAQAKQRSRPTWEEKQATVAALRGLAEPNGSITRWYLLSAARRHTVTVRAVEMWLADPRLTDSSQAAPQRQRYVPTVAHLAVVAQARNLKRAWRLLRDAGELTYAKGTKNYGYSTFARAVKLRTDPAVAKGVLGGGAALVNNRTYASQRASHRNEVWHLDHTQLDIRVLPNHRYRHAIRPWVTAVVDSATGYTLALIPWRDRPNQECVAATLAAAAVARDDQGLTVGGRPGVVVLDNAAEHFGVLVLAITEQLGMFLRPTGPYSGFQNGPAERVLGLTNQMFADTMPGATNAGKTRSGKPRHTTSDPAKVDPNATLTWSAFTHLLESFRQNLNRTVPMRSRGGQTRWQAWQADPTELHLLDPAVIRFAMLRGDRELNICSKSGLQFRNSHYLCAGLRVRNQYRIRHLESVTEFIEVFTEDGTYLGQAYQATALPEKERERLIAERVTQEAIVAACQDAAQQYRKQYARTANSRFGDEPLVWDWVTALVESGRFQQLTDAATDTDASSGPSPRPAVPTRPALPAVTQPGAPVSEHLTDANERLAAHLAGPTANDRGRGGSRTGGQR